MIDKKMKGQLYPAALISTFLFIFIAFMVILMYGNRDIMFGPDGAKGYCTVFVLLFLILFSLCAYCYIKASSQSPGSPPKFWVD